MIKILKKTMKFIFFYIKKCLLKRNFVEIEDNVSFRNSIFSGFNKICSNSRIDNSEIGKYTYISENSILINAQIGSYCSIAPSVEVIYGRHPINFISSHPLFYSSRKQCGFSFLKENKYNEFNLIKNTGKSVFIGNDVWIGYGVKIIEGVSIQDGAVVLAGAIVTKDVEKFSIVGGVPAKHLKYRFENNERKLLSELAWWEKDEKWIKDNFNLFLEPRIFFEKYKVLK